MPNDLIDNLALWYNFDFKMKNLKVIINADDLGISLNVNDAIDDAMRAGWITSATIIAGAQYFKQAVAIAKKYPQCSFGIHLDLMEFGSFSHNMKKSVFCNDRNFFNQSFETKASFFHTREVVDEWMSQIEFIRSHGIHISHIDSHYHVHTLPQVFFALKHVQNLASIPKVRTTRNLIPNSEKKIFKTRIKMFKKYIWHNAVRNMFNGAITTDYFGSVSDFVEFAIDTNREYWRNKTLELMCHPGTSNQIFINECKMLTGGVPLLTDLNPEFISYNNIN
jgi:predicted glycoside hydrolase/deacetylase ChbG (UPF0249 family)